MRITLQKLMLVLALAIGQSPIVWAAASAAAPGSITIQASGITYYAQAGDTLMSIAQRLTTKTGNWVALGTINRINKDSNIPIGTGIIIPTELLADEPTGNLDSHTGKQILDIFKSLHNSTLRTTIIMITHDVEVAEYADRKVTLKDGKIHHAL